VAATARQQRQLVLVTGLRRCPWTAAAPALPLVVPLVLPLVLLLAMKTTRCQMLAA
jgi:hypothetical protein